MQFVKCCEEQTTFRTQIRIYERNPHLRFRSVNGDTDNPTFLLLYILHDMRGRVNGYFPQLLHEML